MPEVLEDQDDLSAIKGIVTALMLGAMMWSVFFSWPAQAQEKIPMSVDILGSNLGQCYKTAALQQENINKIQSELAASQAEVKRLTDKYEPKKAEPEKQ